MMKLSKGYRGVSYHQSGGSAFFMRGSEDPHLVRIDLSMSGFSGQTERW